jgi:CDP-glucose 4,6-dehydratase
MEYGNGAVENLVDQHFWQGKNVLITGHTGFKGGWLSLWLQSLGAQVTGFALPAHTSPNLFQLVNVGAGMTSIIGDVKDFDSLYLAIKKHKPEIIFHLAAQSLVSESYANPLETFNTNILGTVNLFEAVRQTDTVKALVNVTTDKCYENNFQKKTYQENDRLGGYDPYSSSKACAELVTASYRQSFFNARVGVATARAGNVIGGGDWSADRLVPDIMRAYTAKIPLQIRYPDAVRPWQFILEPLQGYLLLAKKLYLQPEVFAQAWNFGPEEGDTKSVRWITEYLLSCGLKNALNPVFLDTNTIHESHYLKLDCSKAKEKLEWNPRWQLEKALQETLKWYQACQLQKNMRNFTLAQIEEYCHGSSITCSDSNC